MNMKKLLETMNDLTECPPMDGAMSAPTNPGNPVTMSISLNASGKDHVADLINMMKNAGLEQAQPAAAAIMPMRTDMERLRGIVDKPEMEDDAAYAEVINDDEELEEYDNEPNPEYRDHKYMTKDLSGGLNREKKSYAAAQPGDNAMAVEGVPAISPKFIKHLQVTFGDKEMLSRSEERKVEDMLNKLSIENIKTLVGADIPHISDKAKEYMRDNTPGGMKNYGDNAMALESKIKAQLYKALTEKKAKPDFLDIDKDGDTKEPMKKAAKDAGKGKGSKPKKGQVPPQFKKKTNEGALEEAYINTSKDAMDTLSALRKIGKSIERGQGSYDGNLANMYSTDVYDVYSFIEKQTNGFQGIDKNTKTAIDAMMTLRGQAKKMEREPGSGKNARFGNDIATTLYPVMSWLSSTNFDRNKTEVYSNEADVPSNFELSSQQKAASEMARKLKRRIDMSDKGGKMLNDVDYVQLSRLAELLNKMGKGANEFSTVKDVYDEMVHNTRIRNKGRDDDGIPFNKKSKDHEPEMTVGRFKELMAMASSTSESAVSEISSDLAKRYTKASKMDRDFNDDDIDRLSKSGQSTRDMQRRNSKRQTGINRAAKRIEK